MLDSRQAVTDELVIVPYQKLRPDTLRSLVEEFVTREGTDYGETETPLELKTAQVIRQLELGTAVIVYAVKSQTCHIITQEESEQISLCQNPKPPTTISES